MVQRCQEYLSQQLLRQHVSILSKLGLYGIIKMNQTFLYLTIGLIVISVAMILIILVQRPQGGGLASAFGGGGGGNDTVFGGRVGDALTVMTVVAFILFLGLAVSLNLVESKSAEPVAEPVTEVTAPTDNSAQDAGPAKTPEPVTSTDNSE